MPVNPNLQKIIKLRQDQYDSLFNGGSITKDGVTYTGLNDNYLYLIQDDREYLQTTGGSLSGSLSITDYSDTPLAINYDYQNTSFLQVDNNDSGYSATFNLDGGLTNDQWYSFPDASGVLALTNDAVTTLKGTSFRIWSSTFDHSGIYRLENSSSPDNSVSLYYNGSSASSSGGVANGSYLFIWIKYVSGIKSQVYWKSFAPSSSKMYRGSTTSSSGTWNNYDNTVDYVSSSANYNYPVLFSYSTSTGNAKSEAVKYNTSFWFNPSTGKLTTTSLAVGDGSATMSYDSTNECIKFTF